VVLSKTLVEFSPPLKDNGKAKHAAGPMFLILDLKIGNP
jgi:hypothetical protein